MKMWDVRCEIGSVNVCVCKFSCSYMVILNGNKYVYGYQIGCGQSWFFTDFNSLNQ